MKQRVNANMIILARGSRGLNQKDLAEKLGVTQGTVSKIENGEPVSEELLEKLAIVLQYPQEFFFESAERYPPGINFYRKHNTLSKKELERIDAQIDIQRIHIQKLLQSAEVIANKIIQLDKDKYEYPEEAAQMIRENWLIPKGPINNLVNYIESTGIVVVFRDFGVYKFSAVSKFTDKLQYIIFVNTNMSSDRMRFTLAHELGHIVMHNISISEFEVEANAFAAEFLMPARDIRHYLFDLDLQKLASLKRYWKVSMGSLIERAYTLGTITDRQRRYLWTKMSRLGYKKHEPPELDPPKESPQLLCKLINLHSNSLGYAVGELSRLLALRTEEYMALYEPTKIDSGRKHLRVIK